MNKIKVVESGSSTLATSGGRWNARIIAAGQGSSGYWSSEALREYGPQTWPAGTHVYYNHLGETEAWERMGSHDVKDLIGVLETDPVFNEEDGGLYTEIRFFSPHNEFVEQVAEYVGLSIETDADIIEGRIVEMFPSPLNAVALVPRAGAKGKLIAATESFKESGRMDSKDGIPASEQSVAESLERKPMTEEEITSLANIVAAAVVAATAPVGTEEAAVDEAAVVESAIVAELGLSARKRVIESVRLGADPDAAIAAEKAIRDEVLAEAKVKFDSEAGVTVNEGATSGAFRPKAW